MAETSFVGLRRAPLSTAYTQEDTPGTVARIERDLRLVTETVRAADPSLESLVLTGGFARGEGTVLDDVPQNDYDLVAVRGPMRPRRPYAELVPELEAELGLHVDLAPVQRWRLPWVAPSIFWYETALRGRLLWGRDVLHRIPIRAPGAIDPREGLRLLTNRAAGLLLVTRSGDAHAYRIQAAKALLAALDAHLLALGRFPPSQTERWRDYVASQERLPLSLTRHAMHLEWAYRFKTSPGSVPPRDPVEVWNAARAALLNAVPSALGHAGAPSLEVYARGDRLPDLLFFQSKAHGLPGVRRWVRNPSGAVRAATLRILAASKDGQIARDAACAYLLPLLPRVEDPIAALAGLRSITLQ